MPADQLVWVLRADSDRAEVEFKGERGHIRLDCLASYPIPRPTLEQIRKMDPCFDLPETAFATDYLDETRFFALVRCKAHGRRFLRDTRGGVGMYTLTTLLEPGDDGAPAEIWAKYHSCSDSWLFHQGRSW